MNTNEIMEKMKAFTGRDGRDYFKGVFERNGYAYVTDGRIALRLKTDSTADTMPAEFPLDAIDGMMGLHDACAQWQSFNTGEFDAMDGTFVKKFKDECVADSKSYRDRYEDVVCPCCNKPLFWDSWNERLVDKKDAQRPTDVRDVEYPVELNFGANTFGCAGFGYLHAVYAAFGESMRYALEPRTEESKVQMILMRTDDDRVRGVLMPVRVVEGVTLEKKLRMSGACA